MKATALVWLAFLCLLLAVITMVSRATAVRAQAQGGPVLALEPFVAANQIEQPVDIAHAGDERLFVVERPGGIRVVQADGTVLPTPFLDIRDRVKSQPGSERGLLGLVFHPNYAENGYFYVNYTAEPDGATHIARFQVTDDANVADPDSEFLILTVEQPFANHNAGDLAFGPSDGYLYVPLGDGGSANDPGNRAQNLQVLLGKLLRIDVDLDAPHAPDCGTPGNYTIPADNPFVDGSGGATCDEIWATGLRNPWRISFDRATHDLYIGDVGQYQREEIDFQAADSPGGENYGWSCYEGTRLNSETSMTSCAPASAYELPIFEYTHDDGCAVTGGYVYRGSRYPALAGHYVLTDYCSGIFWTLDVEKGWQPAPKPTDFNTFGYATFGEAANGELYVANVSNGALLQLTAGEPVLLDKVLYLPLIRKGS